MNNFNFDRESNNMKEQHKSIRSMVKVVFTLAIVVICLSIVFLGGFWVVILRILTNLGLL